MTSEAFPAALHDAAVLVVEDETMISFLIEDMLRDLGCAEVYHARSVAQALPILAARPLSVAILDVNLGRETSLPVAQRLDELNIPFVFATGYGSGGLPPGWKDRPVVKKPFLMRELSDALARVLSLAEKP